MKFLSITGPKADIDRVVNTYLSKYEIHLENALTELSTMQNITPYIQINPYKETLKQAEDFTALPPEDKRTTTKRLSLEDAINCVHGLDHTLGQLNQERTELEAKKKDLMEKAQKIEPFQDLHCNLSSILDFHFIKFRFGKITKEYYNKFESYCYENSDTVFYRCHSDEQYVWGIYFCPRDQVTKVDAVFSSLHFERIYVPDEYSGTPEDAYTALQAEIKKTDDALSECSRKLAKCLSDSAEDLVAAKEQLEQLSGNLMSVAWQPARNPRRKPSIFCAAGCRKKMPLPSRRTSKMTQISSASSRMMQTTFCVSRRQSRKVRKSSVRLRCT